MLRISVDWGLISSSDLGNNESYYLYSEEWYRTISPSRLNSEQRSQVFYLYIDGSIRNDWVDDATGGVH